jgi:hypothetical protein
VSESRDAGQPDDSGEPRTNDQPNAGGQSRNSGQSRSNGQSGGGNQARRANDPIADFQRWLMRAGARSMANQVADQVRRTVGQERRDRGDVWDTATTEPPPEESPECQWCPICQAARAYRTSGPGLMSSVADVSGALASMAQDAFSAFEQMMKTQDQNRSAERSGARPPAETQRPAETTDEQTDAQLPAEPQSPPENTEPTP